MKNYLPLALIAVVLVAGCTSDTGPSGTTGGAAGLAITDFTLNPAEVRSTSTVTVKLVVENQGQRDVSSGDYFALLIGPIGNGVGEWNKNSGENPQNSSSAMRRALGDQKPVPRTFTWSVKSPNSQGADTPVDFTARVYYNYQTEASGIVSVYPDSEVDRATEKSEFTSSKGPLELAVEVNPNPPVIYAETGDEFTLTIHVKNRGNGVVYLNNSVSYGDYNINPETELGKVLLNVSLPSGLALTDRSCTGSIQFFGTSKEEITTCAVSVNKTSTKTPYRISVKADYGYYDEAKARVILKAR